MNNKNEEPKRAFVPKTIGDSLKNINRDFANKYGKIEYIIISKWPEIVGLFFSNHSEPDKISRIPIEENNTGDMIYSNFLHINISPVAAVEFLHFKDKIIDKINSYFGYKLINTIRLETINIKNNKFKNKKKVDKLSKNFEEKINRIKNIEIKKSLNKLLHAMKND